MIHAGYVKITPGKSQTGRVKLKISLDTEEAKFSLGEERKSTESGFTGVGVLQRDVFSDLN